MISRSYISECTHRIVREFKPEKIVLFGSHAYGKPNEDSDIDLLVIMSHVESAVQKAAEIRLALSVDLPVDVIVRTPVQIRERLRMNDYFIRDVLQKGRVLYASDDARVD